MQAVVNQPSRSAFCRSCGKWPACGYVDIDQKHAGRLCEECIAAAKVGAKG
jgi:hypothetical protein